LLVAGIVFYLGFALFLTASYLTTFFYSQLIYGIVTLGCSVICLAECIFVFTLGVIIIFRLTGGQCTFKSLKEQQIHKLKVKIFHQISHPLCSSHILYFY